MMGSIPKKVNALCRVSATPASNFSQRPKNALSWKNRRLHFRSVDDRVFIVCYTFSSDLPFLRRRRRLPDKKCLLPEFLYFPTSYLSVFEKKWKWNMTWKNFWSVIKSLYDVFNLMWQLFNYCLQISRQNYLQDNLSQSKIRWSSNAT